MIFILPLIILAAANQCPYCKWDSCDTSGPLASCSQCYDFAAAVPLKISKSPVYPDIVLADDINTCQLCPDHCHTCEYALILPDWTRPRPVLNCTKCHEGYIRNLVNGRCDACFATCDQGCQYKVQYPINGPGAPYMYMQCKGCNQGRTHHPITKGCTDCPTHCSQCSCQPFLQQKCDYLDCSACEPGYTLTPRANGQGNQCV